MASRISRLDRRFPPVPLLRRLREPSTRWKAEELVPGVERHDAVDLTSLTCIGWLLRRAALKKCVRSDIAAAPGELIALPTVLSAPVELPRRSPST